MKKSNHSRDWRLRAVFSSESPRLSAVSASMIEQTWSLAKARINKPFCIAKREVWEGFKQVKANRGAAGIDGQSIEDFERELSNKPYRIWNRMSSGSYVPPPVRRVSSLRTAHNSDSLPATSSVAQHWSDLGSGRQWRPL